jgi:hypothetical protein
MQASWEGEIAIGPVIFVWAKEFTYISKRIKGREIFGRRMWRFNRKKKRSRGYSY